MGERVSQKIADFAVIALESKGVIVNSGGTLRVDGVEIPRLEQQGVAVEYFGQLGRMVEMITNGIKVKPPVPSVSGAVDTARRSSIEAFRR